MELILNGIAEAIRLIAGGDPDTYTVVVHTLYISGSATLISLIIGIPLGIALGMTRFLGRRAIVSLVNTGMGMPPVVVGLWISIFLWRYGPLGFLHMMYSPGAIIAAQVCIALPIITGFTMAAVQQVNPRLHLQILAMGASRFQYIVSVVKESRMGMLAAVIAGFGSIISEVGASMMVGGNIKGSTRVLTTATSMEVSKGNFAAAVALSIFLMILVYGVTFLMTILQQWERKEKYSELNNDNKKSQKNVKADNSWNFIRYIRKD